MSVVIGVAKLNALVSPISVNQPAKVFPTFVGAAGAVAVVFEGAVWLLTAEPPLLSKLTVTFDVSAVSATSSRKMFVRPVFAALICSNLSACELPSA